MMRLKLENNSYIIFYSELPDVADGNLDFAVELADGRSYAFTAYTPKNLLYLMDGNYKEKLEWVERGTIIVRRIDEECIRCAVNVCIEQGIEWFGIEQRI